MPPKARKSNVKHKQTQLEWGKGEELANRPLQLSSPVRAAPEASAASGLRHAFVDSKRTEDDVVYDTGVSVDDSDDDEEPKLASEAWQDAPQDDQEGSDADDSEEEVQQSSNKGKGRAIVLSSDDSDDDEQPIASSSRSAVKQDVMIINAEDWGSPVSETEASSPVKPSSAIPSKRSATVKSASARKKRSIVSSDGEDEPSPAPVSKGKRKEQERARLEEMLDDEASEASVHSSDEGQFVPRVSAKGKAKAVPKKAVIAASDQESDDEPVKSSRKGKGKAIEKVGKSNSTGKSKGKGRASEAITVDTTDSEEELPNVRDIKRSTITTSKKKRAREPSSSPPPTRRQSEKKRKTSQRRRPSPDPDENDSEGLADSDDEGFIVEEESLLGSPASSQARSRLNLKGKGSAVSKGKGTGKNKKKATRIASSESSEFTDEDDLSLSGKETLQPNRLRTIASPEKGGRFAMLRQARAQKEQEKQRAIDQRRRIVIDSDGEDGSASPGPSSSKQQIRAPRPTYLGAPESTASEGGSDDDDDDSESAKGWEGKDDGSDLDRDEEGFIVDEDDDEEGQKIVAAFRDTMQTKAQGMMYFLKTYLQWLVHLIVCPQVDWLAEDKAFKAAYDNINANLKGLTQSLIGSTAWKVPFKTALDERPIMELVNLEGLHRASPCDACTMGKARHSTLLGTLRGPIYDRRTFQRPKLVESSESESESEDSDDSDAAERKRKAAKRRKAKADARDLEELSFNLGNSCAGRSQVYHELVHWAYTTHERVVTKLKGIQKSFPRPDLRMMSKNERRKVMQDVVLRNRKEADRCASELDKRGDITRFASQLEEEIGAARNNFATNKS